MSKNLPNEFERLAHQDPAEGVHFDESSLLENLASRLPQGTLAQVFPPSDQSNQEIDEQSGEVVALRPRGIAWTQIAASAAVTALAVGGAVTVLNKNGAEQNLAESQYTSVAQAPERLAGPGAVQGPGIALGQTEETSVTNTSMFFGSGRSIYTANGLSTKSESSKVFGFDSSEAITKESFEALKNVFGVSAKTRTSWGSFYAGGEEGDGESLSLQGGAEAAFNYSLNAPLPQVKDLSEQETLTQAQELMSKAGVDPEDFAFESSESEYYPWNDSGVVPDDGATIEPFLEDSSASAETDEAGDSERASSSRALSGEDGTVQSRVVSATLKQFGSDVWSIQWQFEFVGDALVSASGMLADVVDLGEYPVISPAQGLERLNSSAFGALNVLYPEDGYGIMPALPGGEQSYSEDTKPQGIAAPEPGSSVNWQVSKVDLKDARLVFASLYSGERLHVVPVWRYSSTEGIEYDVLALADSELVLGG